jgi:hypothetical protein
MRDGAGPGNIDMGRIPRSPFSSGDVKSQHGGTRGGHGMVLYAALVVFGVGFVMMMRARDYGTSTGPALTLTASAAPDQSTIDNLTASILALSAGHSSIPSGGASTPIAVPPSGDYTTPGYGSNGQPILPTPQTGQAGLAQGLENARVLSQYYSDAYSALTAYKSANPTAQAADYNGTVWSLDPQSLANMRASAAAITDSAAKTAAQNGA